MRAGVRASHLLVYHRVWKFAPAGTLKEGHNHTVKGRQVVLWLPEPTRRAKLIVLQGEPPWRSETLRPQKGRERRAKRRESEPDDGRDRDSSQGT